MKASILIKIFFLVSVLGMVSCLKRDQFPPEPIITEVIFTANADSTGKMLIKFSDGDGDIGLNAGDTLPPYDAAGEFHSNLLFNYFEYINGNWERVYLGIDPETGDTTNPFSYRIPVIETDGRDKALEGEIEIDMPFGYFNPFTPYDSLRYEIVLFDRALNRATAETETILKP